MNGKENNKRVYVETENIDNILKEMADKFNEVGQMLDVSLDKIKESEKSFDTPTSKYFRDTAEEYIGEQKMYISNQLLPLVDFLTEVSKMYNEEYEYEQKLLAEAKESEGNL